MFPVDPVSFRLCSTIFILIYYAFTTQQYKLPALVYLLRLLCTVTWVLGWFGSKKVLVHSNQKHFAEVGND